MTPQIPPPSQLPPPIYTGNITTWLSDFEAYLSAISPSLSAYVFDNIYAPRALPSLQAQYNAVLALLAKSPATASEVLPILARFQTAPATAIAALKTTLPHGPLQTLVALLQDLVVPRAPTQPLDAYLDAFLHRVAAADPLPTARELLIAFMAAGARHAEVSRAAQCILVASALMPPTPLQTRGDLAAIARLATGPPSALPSSPPLKAISLNVQPVLAHAHRRSHANAVIYDPPLSYGDVQRFKFPSQAAPWRKAMARALAQLRAANAIAPLPTPPASATTNSTLVRWVFGKTRSPSGKKLVPVAQLSAAADPRAIDCFHDPPASPALARLSSIRLALRLFPHKSSYRYFDLAHEFHSTPLKTPLVVRMPAVDPTPAHRRPYVRILNCIRGADLTPWSQRVAPVLAKHGYIQSTWDPAVYQLISPRYSKRAFALLLQDHLLLLDDSSDSLHWKSSSVLGHFKHSKLLPVPTALLGAQLVFNKQDILVALTASDLIHVLLTQFDLHNLLRAAQTPNSLSSRDYALILRNLQFLANWVRPDIAAAVKALACPQPAEVDAKTIQLYALLHTLQHSQSYALSFPNYTTFKELRITVYADSNSVSHMAGWAVVLYGTLIFWDSYRVHRSLRSPPETANCDVLRRANAATTLLHEIIRDLTTFKTVKIKHFDFPETLPIATPLVWTPSDDIQSVAAALQQLKSPRAAPLLHFWENFSMDKAAFSLKLRSPAVRLFHKRGHPGQLLSGAYAGPPAKIMGTYMVNVN